MAFPAIVTNYLVSLVRCPQSAKLYHRDDKTPTLAT